MKKIRLGFAGLRHNHIFALYDLAKQKSDIEIAGVFENTAEGINAAKERNIEITHSSYDKLLEETDAVAIGSYYTNRGTLAIEALRAGKHVISDKPLCTSLEELAVIKKTAEEKSLTVGIMLDLRDNKNTAAAQRVIIGGEIGKINNIRFEGQHPLMYGTRPAWYFEKGKYGGVINDIAIHGIDLVRRFTGSDVEKVLAARCWNFYADKCPDFKDSAQLMLEMGNGAGVIADVSYSAPNSHGYSLPFYWEFLICGSKGILRFHANSDGVELYRSGETKVQKISPILTERDYLDEITDEIKGNNTNAVTKQAILSTEQTLRIQQFADMNT